jgi:hypothetical protein
MIGLLSFCAVARTGLGDLDQSDNLSLGSVITLNVPRYRLKAGMAGILRDIAKRAAHFADLL